MVLRRDTFKEPDPPQSFRWLKDGELYLVRPELRGQTQYWYMRKTINGNYVSAYLGVMGSLDKQLLDDAVQTIQAKAGGV